MRPTNLTTRIFIDGGDQAETIRAIDLLGFIDGQTTNPTLIAKNPEVQKRLSEEKKFSEEELYSLYRAVVESVSAHVPHGSVSIEVYADEHTTARDMLAQAKSMFQWISNAHIKFPITTAGLEAAEEAVKEGLRVNMTLCFSQAQAAAVYAATRHAAKGQVFISPFIGRLDDIGQNGLDLIRNCVDMYRVGDGHVEVLAASIRSLDHLFASMQAGADIATVPYKVLAEWKDAGLALPGSDFIYTPTLAPMVYQPYDLEKNWRTFDIEHELTRKGIQKFAADWSALIA